MSEDSVGAIRQTYRRLRGLIPGVEMVQRGQRYWDNPRRLNVVHYYNEDDETPMSSHCDVRAWWLTPDELVAELDPQRLGESNRRSWPREQIIKAGITGADDIIKEGEHAER